MCTAMYQSVSSCLSKGVHSLFQQVGSSYDWLGRKVIDITNCTLANCTLGKTTAYYVEQAVWTLPYTIALIAMPRLYSGISIAVLMMIPQETVQYQLGKDHADNFYTGIRNASLIHAAIDGAAFATTRSIQSLIYCIYDLYTAAQAHLLASSSTPLGIYLQSRQNPTSQ